MKLRTYNVNECFENSETVYRVHMSYKGVSYMNARSHDRDKLIRSADVTIIKHNLPFETKRLKPLKN